VLLPNEGAADRVLKAGAGVVVKEGVPNEGAEKEGLLERANEGGAVETPKEGAVKELVEVVVVLPKAPNVTPALPPTLEAHLSSSGV